jgi:hypothetical protein
MRGEIAQKPWTIGHSERRHRKSLKVFSPNKIAPTAQSIPVVKVSMTVPRPSS